MCSPLTNYPGSIPLTNRRTFNKVGNNLCVHANNANFVCQNHVMEKNVEIGGVNLHYSVSGEGTPVILMHGWGCDHTTLLSVERVAAETNKVYNIDFPGFGKSTEPADVWGVADYVRLLGEFIRLEKIENPILLGHSFGGRVGILYASQNPVKKLILVDAAGIKPRRTLKYYAKVYAFKGGKHLINLLWRGEAAQHQLNRWRGVFGSSDYNGAPPMMRRIMSRVVNEDLKHCLPQIKASTLLIWGENDTATPLNDAKTMERLIPDAGLVSFAGCGHYSFLDNPIQFAAVLRRFLKD